MSDNQGTEFDKYLSNITPNRSSSSTKKKSSVSSSFDIEDKVGNMVPSVKEELKRVAPTVGLFASREVKEIQRLRDQTGVEVAKSDLEIIRTQAKAKLKEAISYWDGKSEAIASGIDAYIASQLQESQAQRTEKTILIIERIRRFANDQLTKIHSDPTMHKIIRDRQINDIIEEMEKSVERIKAEDNRGRDRLGV